MGKKEILSKGSPVSAAKKLISLNFSFSTNSAMVTCWFSSNGVIALTNASNSEMPLEAVPSILKSDIKLGGTLKVTRDSPSSAPALSKTRIKISEDLFSAWVYFSPLYSIL